MTQSITLGDFDFKNQETRWQKNWRETGVYLWDSRESRANTFVIDTPPPTVSGHLHMGHVFSYCQTDIIARYQRMSGKNVYYPVGFDDNGLPTERLVEKEHNVRAADMPRAEFISLCHKVATEAEERYRGLFRHIGLSVDWTQEYQTVSPHAMRMSQMSLMDLHNKGLLYRTSQPTLWDPVDRTAIAQAEVVEKEQKGALYYIPFTDAAGHQVPIATSRPELIAACVAVVVHPDDERMKGLHGTKLYSPIFKAEVPVIADAGVDPNKGTGAVMCSTFGDLRDITWWKTHHLPMRNIIDRAGKLGNMDAFGSTDWPSADPATAKVAIDEINGLNVRQARTKMIEMLKERNLLLGEEQTLQAVPTAERSGAPLEIVPSQQWMIHLLDRKDELIEKGREIQWNPPHMRERYETWVYGLNWDWCISRQRHFGVPVPFWYSKRPGEEGKVILPEVTDLPVDPLKDLPKGYKREEVVGDADVLDTWATSSISPQLNSHGLNKNMALDTERHAKLYPADLRPQAHEIIRTWAFYTVVKSLLHADSAPFHQTAISGWCLARDGTKMSKSKKNVVEPKELLDTYGADAVRYWAARAQLGKDTVIADNQFKDGRRLAMKLWNASKLVAPHLPADEVVKPADELVRTGQITHPVDLWLLTNLNKTVTEATAAFKEMDYTRALTVSEKFFFGTYCDTYLEFSKGRLYGEIGSPQDVNSATRTLQTAHKAVLTLFAPFTPYVTEELYSHLYPADKAALGSIHARGTWTKADNIPVNQTALEQVDAMVDVMSAVRRLKADAKVSVKTAIDELHVASNDGAATSVWNHLAALPADLRHISRADRLTFNAPAEDANRRWFVSDSGRVKISGQLRMA